MLQAIRMTVFASSRNRCPLLALATLDLVAAISAPPPLRNSSELPSCAPISKTLPFFNDADYANYRICRKLRAHLRSELPVAKSSTEPALILQCSKPFSQRLSRFISKFWLIFLVDIRCQHPHLSGPPPKVWDNKLEEREYLKGRLALAFRIMAQYEYFVGLAGHITMWVL